MKSSWIKGEYGHDLYLIFERRLEKIYEEISGDFVGKFGLVDHEVMPDSETGKELSRRWREYLAGLGVSYSTQYDPQNEKATFTNPLYTEPEEFKYIVLNQDLFMKILVVGLP